MGKKFAFCISFRILGSWVQALYVVVLGRAKHSYVDYVIKVDKVELLISIKVESIKVTYKTFKDLSFCS